MIRIIIMFLFLTFISHCEAYQNPVWEIAYKKGNTLYEVDVANIRFISRSDWAYYIIRIRKENNCDVFLVHNHLQLENFYYYKRWAGCLEPTKENSLPIIPKYAHEYGDRAIGNLKLKKKKSWMRAVEQYVYDYVLLYPEKIFFDKPDAWRCPRLPNYAFEQKDAREDW